VQDEIVDSTTQATDMSKYWLKFRLQLNVGANSTFQILRANGGTEWGAVTDDLTYDTDLAGKSLDEFWVLHHSTTSANGFMYIGRIWIAKASEDWPSDA
jgi:hypothetical protein